MGEGHEVVLVAAADHRRADGQGHGQVAGRAPGHLDALERIVRVDGFEVTLSLSTEPAGDDDRFEMESFN